MIKPTILLFGLFTFLIIACGKRYEFWDISKFRMDNTALEDNEPIKIIYTSRGPDFNNDLKYYIHLIAISQKTGDTVNILTTADNGFTMEEKDKVFNFFNQENLVTKLSQLDLEKLKDINHISDINSTELKEINKVARDPKFDYLADNKYPTIIGAIGTTTMKNE